MRKSDQDRIKDAGGFVAGHLRDGRRKKGHALSRSILTLDADFATSALWEEISMLWDEAALVYSTHKHTPAKPRLRLLFPLSRDVSEAEYEPVARKVAHMLGIDQFDDTTYEATRLMYWPSTPTDGEYYFEHKTGVLLDPDRILATYEDWQDVSTWPVSSRQTKAIVSRAQRHADPQTKPGIVGAFCRTYTIQEAIEAFLPEVYAPSTVEGRYDYIPGESAAGLVIYEDIFAYSHHATDPAGGRLCNAFDLVRLHKFGDLDDQATEGAPVNWLPSTRAMNELAAADKTVKTLLGKERLAAASAEFTDATDWMTRLEVNQNGAYKDTLANHVLVTEHDPRLAGIAFNLHRDGIDVRNADGLPWAQIKPGWGESDAANLQIYVQATYGLYSPAKTKAAILAAATGRAYHPVRDYFNALPEWDGTRRIDTYFIDTLGAQDNAYVRAATRKMFVAAVARTFRPGTKYDYVVILNGPQGTGKSTAFAKIGGPWFTDSLTITDMRDKTGAEKLQGYMVAELGELAGMRKAEAEVVKSFVSRTDDKYRAAYGVSVESHPRQCIIVGSTNAEDGFLRDVTGNRRFLPIKITGESEKKPWDVTRNEVDQMWAEALIAFKNGEPLFLSGEAAKIARAEQDAAMETDEREGIVREYLDRPLPLDWYERTLYERREFLSGEDFGQVDLPEDQQRQRFEVSNVEIWAECFGKDPATMRTIDSYEISAIMQKIEDWEKPSGAGARRRIPWYGLQRVYRRKSA
ncbi:virulence-associated E family protein [Trueperella bernardiae]|uniref:virulence-associated E family protein n=1 Tax=Trueperella bernardiae TaxID=59561 RepID=UPI00294A3E81|nr:virulence-associated E family protein [Trueperella bernardiae]MDV6239737.1 virulence-associated E family protein [Trueperella bernardiae]